MTWTLLVPGALLPAPLAPEIARAVQAPRLLQWLAVARLAQAECLDLPSDSTTTPHWAWLARALGLPGAETADAPYAWRATALQDSAEGAAEAAGTWIARCDPVHMAIARDHFVVTGLDEPLDKDAGHQLLAQANAALAERGGIDGAPAPRLHLRAGRFYLLAPSALRLRTFALDGVLGQSVQDRMPTGPDARRWRVLANDVQMCWHASAVNAAREEAGQRTANALWLHGGGHWQALAGARTAHLRLPADGAEQAAIVGWLQAAGMQPAAQPAGGDTLSLDRALFDAHAHQAWQSWLAGLAALEARIAAEHAAAGAVGARSLRLVLCGRHTARAMDIPLAPGWWPWTRARPRNPAALVQRWLSEEPR